MLLFASFLKLRPFQFLLVAICIIFMVPLSLALVVLVPFLIQTLNGTPADLPWSTFLGDQISNLIQPWVQNTKFESGISLEFQKKYFALIIAIIAFLYALFSFLNDYFLNDYGERIAKKLRIDVAIKFLSLPFHSATQVDAGLLSAMVGADPQEVQRTFVKLISSIFKDGIISFVFILWLIFLDYHLFVLFLTISIPAFLILAKTSKVLKRLSKTGIQLESDLFTGMLERMRGWQTIQTYNAQDFEIKRFKKLNENIFHVWRRATRAKALGSPLVEWFAIVAACLVAVIALRRVYGGELTTPILVSFVITVGILGDKITRITNQLNTAKRGVEALRRILTFLKKDLGTRETVNFDVTHPTNENLTSIALSKLSIATQTNNKLVENLSGTFQPGSFVIITGKSGIGKTTFLNVLLGLLKSSSGSISINNQDTSETVYLKFASQIGYIPQSPYIFHGSIFDNIVYPQKIISPTDKNITDAQTALKLANLSVDFNSDVFGLSGGEKQRLMFARLFYNKPRLIIIDEGTSALDIQNENTILQTLRTTLDYSIIFMVSHRVSVKKFATDIIDFSRYQHTT